MMTCRKCLETRATQAATKAAPQTDLEQPVPLLEDLVLQLAESMGSGDRLDTAALRNTAGSAPAVAKALRAVETACIETLRGDVKSPSFEEGVAKLRAVIRASVPRTPVNPQDAAFYHELIDSGSPVPDPRYGRLLAFFQGVMASLRNMLFVYDINGNLLYANDGCLALLKFTREDLLAGLSIYDFVVPQYTDLVETYIDSPGGLMTAPYTIEVYTKDGHRIPLELTTEPIVAGEDVTAIMGIARDLRLERRLEDEIRRSYSCLDNIFANAPIGILITDDTGTIRDANTTAATLVGAPSVNELIGQPACDLLQPDGDELEPSMLRVLEEDRSVKVTLAGKTRFGAKLNCDVRLAPLQNAFENAHGLLVLLVDITDQMLLQENLLRSEKMSALGRVMAGVAHELNNPLTGVLGFSQLLLSSSDLSPSLRNHADRVRTEAERCKRIVESLHSFAQERPQEKTWENINDVLTETVTLCEYQMRVDHITVKLECAPDVPPFSFDRQRIQRVFLNIMNNAHHALASVQGRERILAISTHADASAVRIVFSDNGVGIAKDHMTRIFDPFFTTKGIGEGVGLGLSVAYGVVRDHGGEIQVDSAPSEGTVVTVTLPVRK